MAGYWPSPFCVFMDRDRHKHAKKEQGQYPAIVTEQAWSIIEFIIWLSGKFFLRDAAGRLERAK